MIRYKIIVLFFIFATLVGCNCANYQKLENGVLITLKQSSVNDVQTVCLQVVNNDIIHVTASPSKKLSENPSLIATYSPVTHTDWKVSQEKEDIILQTTTTKAIVSLKTGEIRFTDLKGKTILQEQPGGGKTFKPIQADGHSGYTFRQVFESPVDEAFYGLGQHQSDEFNYKGKNEVLYQYIRKYRYPLLYQTRITEFSGIIIP